MAGIIKGEIEQIAERASRHTGADVKSFQTGLETTSQLLHLVQSALDKMEDQVLALERRSEGRCDATASNREPVTTERLNEGTGAAESIVNLHPNEASARMIPLLGDLVSIEGLVKSEHLNGMAGVVESVDGCEQRFGVQVSVCAVYSIRADN